VVVMVTAPPEFVFSTSWLAGALTLSIVPETCSLGGAVA